MTSPITSSFASEKSALSIVTNGLLFIHLCTGNSHSLGIASARVCSSSLSLISRLFFLQLFFSGYEIELNVIINAQSIVFANFVTRVLGKEYSVRKGAAVVSILEDMDNEQGEDHRDRSAPLADERE